MVVMDDQIRLVLSYESLSQNRVKHTEQKIDSNTGFYRIANVSACPGFFASE